MGSWQFFIRGDIDITNAEGLATTLRSGAAQHPDDDALIDCMDLTFIDAAGIRVLIAVHAELAQQGCDLWLVNPSPILDRLLGILDLTYLIASSLIASSTQPAASN
jgi:anti-anti-sigma factor